MMQDYRKLRVWGLATATAIDVYRLTGCFPPREDYGLTQQIRRAAVSVASNIAEGAGRASRAEFRRFCSIALGSAHEVECQLEIAHRLGYLTEAEAADAADSTRTIIRMLGALMRRLDPDGGKGQP